MGKTRAATHAAVQNKRFHFNLPLARLKNGVL